MEDDSTGQGRLRLVMNFFLSFLSTVPRTFFPGIGKKTNQGGRSFAWLSTSSHPSALSYSVPARPPSPLLSLRPASAQGRAPSPRPAFARRRTPPASPPLPPCAAAARSLPSCVFGVCDPGLELSENFLQLHHVEPTARPSQADGMRGGRATASPAGAGGRCGRARERGRVGYGGGRPGSGSWVPLLCLQPGTLSPALRKARREQQLVSKRLLRDDTLEEAESGCVDLILGEAEVRGQGAP